MSVGRTRVGSHRSATLTRGFQLAECAPDAVVDPAVARATLAWQPVPASGTVAACLRAIGAWSLDGPARDFDASDWWFRVPLALDDIPDVASSPDVNGVLRLDEPVEYALCFDGLATLCDVWLDDAPWLSSDNMFVAHERVLADDLVRRLRDGEVVEIVLRFRSIAHALATRRPRPRWRVPMAAHQQLRYLRTTLLGRTPGWSPPAAAVGLWRPVRIETRRRVRVIDVRLRATLDGTRGCVDATLRIEPIGNARVQRVEFRLARALETSLEATARPDDPHVVRAHASNDGGAHWHARIVVDDPAVWWPHTHGAPALYALDASVVLHDGGEAVEVALGTTGFRTLEACTDDGGFGLRIGGVDVFARGACWTPIDVVALDDDPVAIDMEIARACEAGMNMLRVGGTVTYASDAWLDACDRRGVLVWHDLMFANFDAPYDDPEFAATIAPELAQAFARWQARPAVAVICGDSEAEQQAAMWGAGRDSWAPVAHRERTRALCEHVCPHAVWWPSSAHGGAFPHQADAGTTSYYGVGAYRRGYDDARRSGVRFATECLAFANVPSNATLDALPGGPSIRVHHPEWKRRAPRDLGAGWDFDDVRDHYLRGATGLDPFETRATDPDRYLAAARVASADAMTAAFSEWRRAGSACRGALVWFLRDLWLGAGWGVVDALGRPKAPWYALRRVLQPVALVVTDEGVNGLRLHAINEGPRAIDATLDIALYRGGDVRVAHARSEIGLAPRTTRAIDVAAMLDAFVDVSYAYRFGPPACELLVAHLRSDDDVELARVVHRVGPPPPREADVGLTARVERGDGPDRTLVVGTRRYAHAVVIDLAGYRPDDDGFDLEPGGQRRVRLHPMRPATVVRGTVSALNTETSARVEVA